MDPKQVDAFLKNKVQELKNEKRHTEMLGTIAALGETLTEDIKNAISGIKIETPTIPEIKVPDIHLPEQKEIKIPEITIPEIKLPTINVPAPQVTVNVPEIKLPTINVPEPKVTVNVEKQDAPIVNIPPFPTEMTIQGDVGLRGVDNKTPLPVMMMDGGGKPLQFPVGGGGGRTDFFTIKDIQTSTGTSIIDNDGFVKVTGSFTTSSTPFATYYASDAVGSVNIVQSVSLDVKQLSGSTDSVYVTGVAASFFADIQNPDGRVKVELPTGSSGLTDTELRASSLDVRQVSGSSFSTTVLSMPTVTTTVQGNSFFNATNAVSSTVIKASTGVLHTLTINTRGTGSTIKLYDDLAGVSNQIASIDTTLSTTAFLYDITFTNGLTAVTAGASAADLTISYT